jgi:hypothetical protein
LPLYWLYDLIPGFKAVRFVSRWGIFAITGMACASAILGTIVFKRQRRVLLWLPIVLVVLALIELRPYPLYLIAIPSLVENLPVNRFLRNHPGGVLATLPGRYAVNRFADGVTQDARLTYAASCFHYHPTVNGMSGFDPPFYEKVVLPLLEAFPHSESLKLLEALGVRWIHLQGKFYEKNHFDDLVAFAASHPERFRLVFHQGNEVVLERLGLFSDPIVPPADETPAIQSLPKGCAVSTSINPTEARYLIDQNLGTVWSTNAPQRGAEKIDISCKQLLAISGFVLELGGRYAEYPRGLIIEYMRENGTWSQLLVEDNAIDLSRLVFHPNVDRVLKTFAPAQAATWRIRQIGTSVKNPWSVAEIKIIPTFKKY